MKKSPRCVIAGNTAGKCCCCQRRRLLGKVDSNVILVFSGGRQWRTAIWASYAGVHSGFRGASETGRGVVIVLARGQGPVRANHGLGRRGLENRLGFQASGLSSDAPDALEKTPPESTRTSVPRTIDRFT